MLRLPEKTDQKRQDLDFRPYEISWIPSSRVLEDDRLDMVGDPTCNSGEECFANLFQAALREGENPHTYEIREGSERILLGMISVEEAELRPAPESIDGTLAVLQSCPDDNTFVLMEVECRSQKHVLYFCFNLSTRTMHHRKQGRIFGPQPVLNGAPLGHSLALRQTHGVRRRPVRHRTASHPLCLVRQFSQRATLPCCPPPFPLRTLSSRD